MKLLTRDISSFRKSKCSCGRAILWAQTHDGKKIPLDAIAPVYTVIGTYDDQETAPLCVRNAMSLVNHFVTCPDRDSFRQKVK